MIKTGVEVLREWAAEIEPTLPQLCPRCLSELDTIRYAHERDQMRIYLTGVTIDYDYYVAGCPHCGRELARKCLGMHRSFWK